MTKLFRFVSTVLLASILLSACNIPINVPDSAGQSAVLTAAAQTVQAQLNTLNTATLPAVSFTNTAIPSPLPTNTFPPPPPTAVAASATSNCDAAQFVTDVTIPDGTILTPGQNFTKTWRLKNIGTCSWTTAYAAVFSSGNSMGGPATQALTGNVNAGQTVDISMNLTAPGTPGSYTGNYRLRNASGVLFSQFYVQIQVQNSGGGGGGGPFAVTGVTYTLTTVTLAGHAGCPKVTAHITANGEGDVTYRWTRSDNAGSPTENLHFNSAGTKDVSETWSLGSVWAGGDPEWLGIYIDDPNHQDFGHIEVNACSS